MSDTPDNGFGQGAVNNSTGWSKGFANSSLGWGSIHPLTFGHPNTNLTGDGGTVPFPTDLLDWSQIFNNAYEVNSGAGINMTVVNGDNISYPDLTGVTVVSQTGTANIQVVGNELQPQNNGNLFEYELSNGIKWNGLSSNVSDFTAYDINSIENGTINGASWITGRPQGAQLYEYGYNSYGYFNGTNWIDEGTTTTLSGEAWVEWTILSSVENKVVAGANTGNRYLVMRTTSAARIRINSTYYNWSNLSFSSTHLFPYTKPTTLRITKEANTDLTLSITVDGVTEFSTISGTSDPFLLRYHGTRTSLSDSFEGTIISHKRSDGTEIYNLEDWNGNAKIGTFTQSYITGATKEATTDIFGETITRPAIANFYNAPAYDNHYAQLEELAGGEIDTSSAITTAFWINPQEGGTVYDNGAIKATYNGTNLTFTRDGVTTISYTVALTELTYFAITSDASGVTNIYQANQSTSPSIVVTSQAGGTPTAASVPMYANNTNALNGRYGGYNQLTGFWSKVLTTEEIEASWSASQ